VQIDLIHLVVDSIEFVEDGERLITHHGIHQDIAILAVQW